MNKTINQCRDAMLASPGGIMRSRSFFAVIKFNSVITLILFAIILFSCKKEEPIQPAPVPHVNKPPQDFKITPEEITGNSIVISFTESSDQDLEKVKYRFSVNGNLITDNQNYTGSFKFENLQPETSYTVKVTAFDKEGKTIDQSIKLKTLTSGARIKLRWMIEENPSLEPKRNYLGKLLEEYENRNWGEEINEALVEESDRAEKLIEKEINLTLCSRGGGC